MEKNALLRIDNVGIVVESLDNSISFFTEIGLKFEGRATIEGEWSGRVTGVEGDSTSDHLCIQREAERLNSLNELENDIKQMSKPKE